MVLAVEGTLLLLLVGLSFLEVRQIIVEMTSMMSKITRTAPPLAVPITIALAGRLEVLGEGVGCGVLTTSTDVVVEEGERDGRDDGDDGAVFLRGRDVVVEGVGQLNGPAK